MACMEKFIMPELITPALGELLASNPKILEQLLKGQTDEKAVSGRDIELDASDDSRNLKFIFCNVNIKIDSSVHGGYGAKDSNDKGSDTSGLSFKEEMSGVIRNLGIKDGQLDERAIKIEELTKEVRLLEDEILILETRIKESKNALKFIAGVYSNRKLSYKYKKDLKSFCCNLIGKRACLEEKTWLLRCEKESRAILEQESKELTMLLFKKLLQ